MCDNSKDNGVEFISIEDEIKMWDYIILYVE